MLKCVMNTDLYIKLARDVQKVSGDNQGLNHEFIEDLVALVKAYHSQDVSIPFTADILFETALAMMASMTDFGKTIEFSKYAKKGCEQSIQLYSQYWPPLDDKDRWPNKI